MNDSARRFAEEEILAEAALFGRDALDTDDRAWMDSRGGAVNEFEKVAACLLMDRTERRQIDSDWLSRMEARLDELVGEKPTRLEARPGLADSIQSRVSWWGLGLAVAASFAIGVSLGWWRGTLQESPQVVMTESPEARFRTISDLSDSIRVDWAPNAGGDVSGYVVWNDRLQEGYMAFEQLAANDPRIEQYQLWIFDAARSDDHPVDGGVFDIAVESAVRVDGMTLIPVDAKLPVTRAKMFALTVEAPGGAVVSDRTRLPGLAVVP